MKTASSSPSLSHNSGGLSTSGLHTAYHPYKNTTIAGWMDEAFAGLTSYCCIVDNIIIYDSDITEHTDHVTQFLQSWAEKHITMNVSKWKFAQPQADFAGFMVAADGYRVDQSIIEAIAIFPTPTNHTDLRSFVSLVNQLLAITATPAGLLTLLHPLLSTKNEFT